MTHVGRWSLVDCDAGSVFMARPYRTRVTAVALRGGQRVRTSLDNLRVSCRGRSVPKLSAASQWLFSRAVPLPNLALRLLNQKLAR